MKVLVSDTNIWIDLYHGGLLEAVFRLPYQFVTTDFVWQELHKPPGASLLELGLTVEGLDSTDLAELHMLMGRLNSSSLADVSCYYLAASRKWTLLTGDKAVRKDGEAAQLEVRGVLWLMDELYINTLLNGEELAAALQVMLENGARLPDKECKLRILRWLS